MTFSIFQRKSVYQIISDTSVSYPNATFSEFMRILNRQTDITEDWGYGLQDEGASQNAPHISNFKLPHDICHFQPYTGNWHSVQPL